VYHHWNNRWDWRGTIQRRTTRCLLLEGLLLTLLVLLLWRWLLLLTAKPHVPYKSQIVAVGSPAAAGSAAVALLLRCVVGLLWF
jgi:hypothetical protein